MRLPPLVTLHIHLPNNYQREREIINVECLIDDVTLIFEKMINVLQAKFKMYFKK